jgi:Ca2+-dependent lipid-binding protein
MEADMEFILLGVLAKIGLGCIVVGTLALLAMHVVENQKPGLTERPLNRKAVDAVDFRLHHFPRVKQPEADDTIEEPTQRAA